jgi:hypothetical protein
VFIGDGIVEHKEEREIREDGGNHLETLAHQRLLCGIQVTIPVTACKTIDRAVNNTDMRASMPNLGGHTPDCS